MNISRAQSKIPQWLRVQQYLFHSFKWLHSHSFKPLNPPFSPSNICHKKVFSSGYNAKAHISPSAGHSSNLNACFLSISHGTKAKEVFIPFIMQFLTPTNLPLPPVLINTALKLSLPVYLCKPAAELTAVPFPSAPPTAPLNQLFIRSTGTSVLIAMRFVASGPKWSAITQKVFCSFLIFQFFLKSLQNSQTLEGLRFYSSLSALTEIIPFTMRNPVLEARRWHYLLPECQASWALRALFPTICNTSLLFIFSSVRILSHTLCLICCLRCCELLSRADLSYPCCTKYFVFCFSEISVVVTVSVRKNQLNREKPQHWEWGGF